MITNFYSIYNEKTKDYDNVLDQKPTENFHECNAIQNGGWCEKTLSLDLNQLLILHGNKTRQKQKRRHCDQI